MKEYSVKTLLIIIFLSMNVAANASTTQYVSDKLSVNMRSGQSNQHKIIQMVSSGTPVEVLKTDEDSGYSLIKTPKDNEGWVLSRYLDNIPSARNRLESTKNTLDQLQSENKKLRNNYNQLKKEKAVLSTEEKKLSKDNQRIKQELTRIQQVSASSLALDNENKSIKDQLRQLERQHQIVQQENESLKDRTARDWFMVGAGVVLLGIGIGLIIPKIRWRKKSSWSSL